MEQARIRILREAQSWADALRKYRVLLDGKRVGNIENGGALTLEVEPGRHQLQMRIDWASSPRVLVEVGPGKEAVLGCGSTLSLTRAPLQAFLHPRSYLYLRLEPGPGSPWPRI